MTIPLILLGLAQFALIPGAGGWSWLVAWSGLSWILAGSAYGGLGNRIFGKRSDGTMAGDRVFVLLPFLAVNELLWHLHRLATREPALQEIAPGLWLGRRCYGRELPPDIRLVVDLTTEFCELREVRTGRTYLCLPTLDASAPPIEAFNRLIQTIATEVKAQEAVYIHCALGHGRSATVMIAAVVATGAAVTIEQAEQRVRQIRPGVKIHAGQRRLLQEWAIIRASGSE